MPVPSLPTELLEEIIYLADNELTTLGEAWAFAREINLVNRRWTPIGRSILWRELSLPMARDEYIDFKKHLDLYPHLAEYVKVITLYREDPNDAARALNWEASKIDSLLEIVRRCQNLTFLYLHFIPDNGGSGFGKPTGNIDKPYYNLFEATSKLPKLERFEIFWPELTLERFASIIVPGFPALHELKLSIGESRGHELEWYSDYDPTTELAAGIVQSPVEVLTVTLGAAPAAMCRIIRRAINPSILTELYIHGNGISNYDELPQWIASFPALERLSLRLRGEEQQEVLPALSTALTSLQHLTHVLLRRNWDSWDNKQSRGEFYWSPVALKDLLARLPPQIERFVLEGLVFPAAPLHDLAYLEGGDELPPSESWFFGQMVSDGNQENFHLLVTELSDIEDEPENAGPEWHWAKESPILPPKIHTSTYGYEYAEHLDICKFFGEETN